jgi:type IV pilus assembly protein PilQ
MKKQRLKLNNPILKRGLIFFICICVQPILVSFASSIPTIEQNKNSKLLTLNFQNINIRSTLQLLAQFSGVNIVVSDNVKGNITLHLQEVPWRQALEVIIRTQGLRAINLDNVMFIAPAQEIVEREKQEMLTAHQREDYEPLQSRLIQVNYGKAADIASLLKQQNSSLLSKRGNFGVDTRTNTIWLEDIPEKLVEVTQLIRRLDRPVRQVLIEARIVNIDKKYERDLGIRWHLANQSATNNANDDQNSGSQALNLDLPTASLGMANGNPSLGLVMLKLGNNVLLDLELSALESSGNAKIIATPQIVTANQKEAVIEAGEEIPFQRASASGATAVTFKKAVLSLRVSPQITPDNRVILDLTVNQDKRGPEIIHGVPAIDTREIKTQVLVHNGQTIVLGGIYQQSNSDNVERIPFLGTLPVLGPLFRHTIKLVERRELLIFVTPRIMKLYE